MANLTPGMANYVVTSMAIFFSKNGEGLTTMAIFFSEIHKKCMDMLRRDDYNGHPYFLHILENKEGAQW